jgi:hypothetical protein
MSPDEYRAMFRQVYGYEPEEGNSYLSTDEKPDDVSWSEYNKYRDYSGAIDYMDEDYYEYSPIYADESDEEDVLDNYPTNVIINPVHGEPYSTAIDSLVHAFPLPHHQVQEIEALPIDTPAKLIVHSGGESAIESIATLRQCPCFCVSIGDFKPWPGEHFCDNCNWCKAVPPVNPHHVLIGLGATYTVPSNCRIRSPAFATAQVEPSIPGYLKFYTGIRSPQAYLGQVKGHRLKVTLLFSQQVRKNIKRTLPSKTAIQVIVRRHCDAFKFKTVMPIWSWNKPRPSRDPHKPIAMHRVGWKPSVPCYKDPPLADKFRLPNPSSAIDK